MSRFRSRYRIYGLYHQKYSSAKEPEGICAYCGNYASVTDHCPPLAWVDAKGAEWFENAGIPLVLVPSCSSCNQILSSHQEFTVKQRRVFVKRKLAKKYKKLLAMPVWTEGELAEMGAVMRAEIVAAQKKQEVMKLRLAYPHKNVWWWKT